VEQQQRRDLANALTTRLPTAAHSTSSTIDTAPFPITEDKEKESELFQALLKSVASNNIATLQQGLAKQSIYWVGVAWVAQALEQRLSGVAAGAIDLGLVTEKLASFVSVPDAGLLRDREGVSHKLLGMGNGNGDGDASGNGNGHRVQSGRGSLSETMPVLSNLDLEMSKSFSSLEQIIGADGGVKQQIQVSSLLHLSISDGRMRIDQYSGWSDDPYMVMSP